MTACAAARVEGAGSGWIVLGPEGVRAETTAAAAAGDIVAARFAGADACAGVAGAASAPERGVVNAGGGAGNDFLSDIVGRYGSYCRGRFGVTPLELFGRMCGVIITTSSVWFFCADLLLKSRPRTGMSPMPGTFERLEVTVLLIRPAMANV